MDYRTAGYSSGVQDSPWLGLTFEPPKPVDQVLELEYFDDYEDTGDIDFVDDEGREKADGAERLLRRFLRLCESERMAPTMLRMVESAARGEGNGRRIYNMLNRLVLNPVARASGMHASALRMELVGSQLIGLAMMRYVLKVEPVCSASIDDIVMRMAPAIRATLKG